MKTSLRPTQVILCLVAALFGFLTATDVSATPTLAFTISGRIYNSSNNPIAGVGVSASATINGTNYSTANNNTDTSGNYSLNVPGNANWTVTVTNSGGSNSLDALGYNPVDPQTLTLGTNNGSANFLVPSLGEVELWGHVLDTNTGAPLAGVSVYASSSGYPNQTNQTDANGFYEFIVGNGFWDVSVNCTNLSSLGYNCVSELDNIGVGFFNSGMNDFLATPLVNPFMPFFNGQASLGNQIFYLADTTNNIFGYYSMKYYPYVYHLDMGFEYFFDAQNSSRAAYLYDFKSNTFFYTDPNTFPYLYDFSLNAWLYYFPDHNNPGRYSSNPRYFADLTHGGIITK